ncbi:glycosyl-transferase for dystroglycan-domain-containing protein [Chytriomyces sp. MP71]|nr:glycosyl-transferase for dystroglycan-domain-containing protein [Chytriomyces sp. MP71]
MKWTSFLAVLGSLGRVVLCQYNYSQLGIVRRVPLEAYGNLQGWFGGGGSVGVDEEREGSTFMLRLIKGDDGTYDGSNSVEHATAPGFRFFCDGGGASEGCDRASWAPRLASDATLFTQLSLDRFHLLPSLLSTWDASLSVAIYVEHVADLPQLNEKIASLGILVQTHAEEWFANGRCVVISLLFGVEFLFAAPPDPASNYTKPDFNSLHHPYDLLYPINALRNLAMREVRTDLIFSLDADFVPSPHAHSLIMQLPGINDVLYNARKPAVLVLAAFEEVWDNASSELPHNDAAAAFQFLQQECVRGRIVPFHYRVNPVNIAKVLKKNRHAFESWCYGMSGTPPKGVSATAVQSHTNFTNWFSTTTLYEIPSLGSIVASAQDRAKLEFHLQQRDEKVNFIINPKQQTLPSLPNAEIVLDALDSVDTAVTRTQQTLHTKKSSIKSINRYYEPYFIARRAIVPPFDEKFRGYSFNKRSHSIEMQARGIRMHVVPQPVFVLHRWHTESASRKTWRGGERGVVKKTVGRAYERFLKRVKDRFNGMWVRKQRLDFHTLAATT